MAKEAPDGAVIRESWFVILKTGSLTHRFRKNPSGPLGHLPFTGEAPL